MFVDDRLATVLRHRASSEVGLRTQFRQLLDILGAERTGSSRALYHSFDRELVGSGWLRLDALAQEIPADERASMIRESGWRFRNPELAANLAECEPAVAAAALGRAQLSGEDWTTLIPRLPIRARGFLRLRDDLPQEAEAMLEQLGVHDRGLPAPASEANVAAAENTYVGEELTPEEMLIEDTGVDDAWVEADVPAAPIADIERAASAFDPQEAFPQANVPKANTPQARDPQAIDPQAQGRSEISALVERIAQFKRSRDNQRDNDHSEPRLPLGEEPQRDDRRISAFGFAADAGGRIEWSDAEVAPMVIGTRLIAPPRIGSAQDEDALTRAFPHRQPIASVARVLNGAQAIAGEWIVDAQPRFTDDGNFSGYVGRFRRPAAQQGVRATAAEREADHIRQLLHELRTPVTAVQGYAEVIQQQLFGAAPHEYRALAASIAGDAARILAGFEELDRLAKLESGALDMEAGEADLAALALRTNRQLDLVLQPRMAGLELVQGGAALPVSLDNDQAESLLWRLLATLGGGCASGEMLEMSLSSAGGMARLSCDLPAQLLGEGDVFTAEATPVGSAINAGLFGAGFALRLARAEARRAGGDLIRDDEAMVLTLPLAVAETMKEAAGEN